MTEARHSNGRAWLAAGSIAAIAVATPLASSAAAAPVVIRGTPTPSVSVYATGFNNPRGLKFGPDGMLYVAEAGVAGSNSTVGKCEQVPAPVGPYTGSARGGRISRVDSNGNRTTVTDRLPASKANPAVGGDPEGVADVAFIGNTLYALVAGGGCSHGVLNGPNGIYRITATGAPVLIADLGAFQKTHPVAHPEPGDFEPEGTWYSLVAAGQTLYALEPNHGELDKISMTGSVSRVVDLSASQGHIVPTAMAYHGGAFYVGNLDTFPIAPGSSKILLITRAGTVSTIVTGLTTVLGVAFDDVGRMYVLENTTTAGFPSPGRGDVVRIVGGKRQVIASGLNLPTGMTFGPDGALYVSVWGFGMPPSLPNGPGQVLRIRLGS
jgi:hypothetical protein